MHVSISRFMLIFVLLLFIVIFTKYNSKVTGTYEIGENSIMKILGISNVLNSSQILFTSEVSNKDESINEETQRSKEQLEVASKNFNGEEVSHEDETINEDTQGSRELEEDVSKKNTWEEETRDRMASRLVNLKKACQKNERDSTITKEVKMNRFFYSRNLLACSNAKVGSQTMAQLFFKLIGLKSFKIYGKDRSKVLASKVLGDSKVTELLRLQDHPENYAVKNFMVVRNPLDRLVSVYREKYWGGNTFINTRIYSLNPLGKINNITYEKGKRYSVTFTQFLNLITEKTDRHWIPIHKYCAPCYNHYDYFLYLETFNDDIRYIFKQVGINMAHEDTQRNNATRKAGTKLPVEDYFKGVPKPLLREVLNIYRLDFELFGYEIPNFLK